MGNPTAIVPVRRSVLMPAWQKGSYQNAVEGKDTSALGVFSSFPTSTKKWSRLRPREGDDVNTMARMFIRVPPGDYDAFLASLDDPVTREIATHLTGDDAGKGGVGYLDFLLQNATQQFNEKVQVCETLSDNYVAFFFGSQAPMFTYSGALYNTYEDDWAMRMLRIFRDLGRGTQLARNNQILSLRYDSVVVQGAMVNFRYTTIAGREMAVKFNFSLLVKSVNIVFGGVSKPTDLIGVKHFAPRGYHTEDASDVAATNTYLGDGATGPEGVSEGPPVDQTSAYDATGGGTSFMPEEWEESAFETPPPPSPGLQSKTANTTMSRQSEDWEEDVYNSTPEEELSGTAAKKSAQELMAAYEKQTHSGSV